MIANLGTITTEVAAIKTTSAMLNIPAVPDVLLMLVSFTSSSPKAITS